MIGFDALLIIVFAGFVASLKPGPYILTIAALASSGHYKSIMAFVIGAYLSTLIVYPALLMGVSFIAANNLSFIFFLLKTIAAVWFIWVGIKTLPFKFDDTENIVTNEDEFTSKTWFQNGFAGFILTFCNPYDIIFVTGGIPALVDQEMFTLMQSFFISIAVLIGDIFALAVYILPVLLFRKWINSINLSILKTITGVSIICIGIYIGYTALMADDLLSSGILN